MNKIGNIGSILLVNISGRDSILENKFRIIPGKSMKATAEDNSEVKLLKEIKDVCRQIENAYASFEYEQDEDLVEAAIYELEALKARYRYLLRIAKAQKITCEATKSLETETEVRDNMG